MSAMYLCQDCDRYQPRGYYVVCKFCGSDEVYRETSPDDQDGEGDR